MRALHGLRLSSPTIMRYFVSIVLVGFAIDGGVYAVLFNLFLLRLSYRPEQIGLINAVGTLTFALACLPAGVLGGRYGSRRMMLIGLTLTLAGAVLLPLVDTLPLAWQLPWLIATTMLLYAGLAGYFVNTTPYVMGVISADQRNQVFSFQTALLSLASFVGSLAGGLLPPIIAALLGVTLTHPAPYRYALIIAGATLLAAIVSLQRARESTPLPAALPEPASAPAAAPVRPILALLLMIALVRVLQVSGLAVTTSFFNVYLDSALHVPTVQIGAIIALGRLLGVPAALATAALAARFGNRAVVIGASLGTALSILPIAFLPHWGSAGLSFICVIGLSWIRYTAALVYFLDLVPPTQRATVSGVAEMSSGICFTIMTFGGGYVIARFGYPSLFLTGAALTAFSALVFWLCFGRRSRRLSS